MAIKGRTPQRTQQAPQQNKAAAILTFVRETKTYYVYEDKEKVLSTGTIYISKDKLNNGAPPTISMVVVF